METLANFASRTTVGETDLFVPRGLELIEVTIRGHLEEQRRHLADVALAFQNEPSVKVLGFTGIFEIPLDCVSGRGAVIRFWHRVVPR
jgi:hypothetical protein